MSKNPYPSDQQDKFMLRLPDGMRDRIKAVADTSNRSMNAEIVALLEEHFPPLPNIKEVLEEARVTANELEVMLGSRDGQLGTTERWLARALLDKLRDIERIIEKR